MAKDALAPVVSDPAPLALRELAEDNAQDIAGSTAQNTRRAYQSDWRTFSAWCGQFGFACMPATPEVVAAYLTHLANEGKKASTILRALATISQAHKLKELPTPRSSARVQKTLEGVLRRVGVAQTAKSPLLPDLLGRMCLLMPMSLAGARDRALLTLGFAGAFRRSELIGLNVEDLTFEEHGLVVTLRRSKTDQRGEGRRIGITHGKNAETCPVRAVRTWLDMIGAPAEGPLFCALGGGHYGARLSGAVVAQIVKHYAEAIGLDASKYSGHSLRAGFATAAARAGKHERTIMAQTGHKSSAMLARYIREIGLFEDNASEGLL